MSSTIPTAPVAEPKRPRMNWQATRQAIADAIAEYNEALRREMGKEARSRTVKTQHAHTLYRMADKLFEIYNRGKEPVQPEQLYFQTNLATMAGELFKHYTRLRDAAKVVETHITRLTDAGLLEFQEVRNEGYEIRYRGTYRQFLRIRPDLLVFDDSEPG